MKGDRGRDTYMYKCTQTHTHTCNEMEEEGEASITRGKRIEEKREMGGDSGSVG